VGPRLVMTIPVVVAIVCQQHLITCVYPFRADLMSIACLISCQCCPVCTCQETCSYSPITIMGVPCDSMRASIMFLTWRLRRASTPWSPVPPSALHQEQHGVGGANSS
jgi:hypothetical protein